MAAPSSKRPRRQLRDMWMCEPGEDGALAFEAFLAAASRECDVEKLHGGLTFEPPIAALGEPNATHAALADRRHQGIRTDRLASQGRVNGQRSGRQLEKMLFLEDAILAQ